MQIEVGVSGLTRPPVDALIPMVKGLEDAGIDAVWFADHFLHWYPPSVWTPDIFPQAATEPSAHTFLDPGPLMGAVATHTGSLADRLARVVAGQAAFVHRMTGLVHRAEQA